MKHRLFRTVRVKYPNEDGYIVVLHPLQGLKIHVPYNDKLNGDTRVILDSEYFGLDRRYAGKDNEIIYEFCQKYNLTEWARCSSVFLGELHVKTFENYRRVGLYLDNFSKIPSNILTVINPRNGLIRVNDQSILHIVLGDGKADYRFVKEINDEKSSSLIRLESSIYKSNLSYNLKHHVEESHLWFRVKGNMNNTDFQNGSHAKGIGTIEISRTLNNIRETGFLKLLLSVKRTGEHSILHNHWDDKNHILINPSYSTSVNIDENHNSFDIEIISPAALIPEIKNDKCIWTISAPNIFNITEKSSDEVQYKDNLYRIQKFHINAECKTHCMRKLGSIVLKCQESNTSSVNIRYVDVFVSPILTRNFQKEYVDTYQPTTYTYHKVTPTAYTSIVDIDKIPGDLEHGTEIKKICLSSNISAPVSTYPIGHVKKKMDGRVLYGPILPTSSNCIFISNPSVSERVNLRKDTRLVIKLDLPIDKDGNPLFWSCNIFQNKTYLLNISSSVKKEDGKFVQEFEFGISPWYIPKSNRTYHYISGIRFSKGNGPGNKYVAIYLTHSSRYDSNTEFDQRYLATGFIERFIENKVSAPYISQEDSKIILNSWPHQTGLILNPCKITEIKLPHPPGNEAKIGFLNGQWNVKLKQYPIPKLLWDGILDKMDDDLDRYAPWWPEDHPKSAVYSYKIPPITGYQKRFYEISEKYYEHFKEISIPVGELIFKSDLIKQSRELDNTLVRTIQQYTKKIYLYVNIYHISLLRKNFDKDYVEFTPSLDRQSIVIPPNKSLIIHINSTNSTVLCMPYWMRLKEEVTHLGKKMFIFDISEKDISSFNEDEMNYSENWIVINDDGKINRIKVLLDQSTDYE